MSLFAGFTDYVFGVSSPGGENDRQADFETRNAALNDRRVALGLVTRDEANRQEGAVHDVYDGQVADAFTQGAADALANEQSWFKKTLNGITGGALGFIPGWVWVGALVAAAVWLETETGFLRRRLSKS